MKKTVCAVLALVMLALCFTLVSCSGGKSGTGETKPAETEGYTPNGPIAVGTVIGTWTADVPAATFLFPGDRWDTESCEWTDGTIHLSLVFYEAGSLVLGLRKSDVKDFILNNFESAVAMFGYTVEEVMTEGHYETTEAAADDMIEQFTSLNKNGKFTVSGDVMTIELVSTTHSHGKEEEKEEVLSEIKFKLQGDTLTFTGYAEESEEHNLFDPAVLPLTFRKSK